MTCLWHDKFDKRFGAITYATLIDVMTNVLTSWNFLTKCHTSWRLDALFDVMSNFMTSWCVFTFCWHDVFVAPWPAFCRLDIFCSLFQEQNIMKTCFDIITNFWMSWYVFHVNMNFLMSWRVFVFMTNCLTLWRIFDFMTHFLTSWHIFSSAVPPGRGALQMPTRPSAASSSTLRGGKGQSQKCFSNFFSFLAWSFFGMPLTTFPKMDLVESL